MSLTPTDFARRLQQKFTQKYMLCQAEFCFHKTLCTKGGSSGEVVYSEMNKTGLIFNRRHVWKDDFKNGVIDSLFDTGGVSKKGHALMANGI